MQIFIIHDGQQAGPFTEDAVQTLLTKGHVRPNDMGWRKGLPAWLPLSRVLEPAAGAVNAPPPVPSSKAPAGTNDTPPRESAMTPKQVALLKYLGAEIGEDATRETAAIAISDALEKPKLQDRIRKWHDEKLRLHPDIFQDEIDFRRANRVSHYLELCQTDGAEAVTDVTKAHVHVLVESLDRRFPRWETDPAAALWDYLLPAIAEHFPKLVRPEWKGPLTLGGISKVAAAATGRKTGRQTGGALPPPPAPSGALGAAGRGIIYGAIALVVIFGGIMARDHWKPDASKRAPQNPPTAIPVATPDKPSAPTPPPAVKPVETPAVNTTPPDKAPLAGPDQPPVPPVAPPAPAPAAPAPAPPLPVPVAPVAEEKPARMDDKSPPPPAPNPAAIPETPPAISAPVAPRTFVTLTQGIGVSLANGQMKLSAGTPLRISAIEGANLKVMWNDQVFYVPAIATDIAKGTPSAPPGTPVVAPGAPQPPIVPNAPPATAAPPTPSDIKPAPKAGSDL